METKEKIMTRAGELFKYMGLKNMTMDFLAADLEMSKRTIYERFRHKEQLIIETLHHLLKLENKEMLKIIDETEHVIEALFIIINHKRELRMSCPEIFHQDVKKYIPQLQQVYYANINELQQLSPSFILIEKGIREDVFRKDLSVQHVDSFIQDLLGIFHNSSRIGSLKPTEEEILRNAILPYFRGLCTKKGVELMDAYFEKIIEYNIA